MSTPTEILVFADLTGDASVTRADAATLLRNMGTPSGAMLLDGDLNGDGAVSLADLAILQSNIESQQEAMGGGGGMEETSGGQQKEQPQSEEESSTGGGGGTAELTITPGRIYITTSGAIPGGGVLPEEVPEVTLDEPGHTVELFVWVDLGGHTKMGAYNFDIEATDPDVVKATTSEFFDAEIILTEYDDFHIGDRYGEGRLRQPIVNPDGAGEERLSIDALGLGVFSYGMNAANDGEDPYGTLDMLYDPTSGAFLAQVVELEALEGSEGMSTGIILTVGRQHFLMDVTVEERFIYFGLGETLVGNYIAGDTDGTDHAIISVAAAGPAPSTAPPAFWFEAETESAAVSDGRMAVDVRRGRETLARRVRIDGPVVSSDPATARIDRYHASFAAGEHAKQPMHRLLRASIARYPDRAADVQIGMLAASI
jgi:hypothetical protein